MKQIGFDTLLEFILSGEDEKLVRLTFRDQADGAELLARARTAIELLSPEGVGKDVSDRLQQLAAAVAPEGTARPRGRASRAYTGKDQLREDAEPPSRGTGIARRRSGASEFRSKFRLAKKGIGRNRALPDFDPAPDGPVDDGLLADISQYDAIRSFAERGAAQFLSLGSLLLDRRSDPPITRVGPPGDELPAAAFMKAALRAPSPDAPDQLRIPAGPGEGASERQPLGGDLFFSLRRGAPARDFADEIPDLEPQTPPLTLPLPRGGELSLRCDRTQSGDRLVVHLGNKSSPGITQVMWLPENGEVVRAYTDAAGEASLPWPGPGRGVLRIDAARTLECRCEVRL
jgi:hypothetical protein